MNQLSTGPAVTEAALQSMSETFSVNLASIRQTHGSAWVVFHDDRALAGFPSFAEAAEFAFHELGEADYLIRHTYQEPEFVPLLLVG